MHFPVSDDSSLYSSFLSVWFPTPWAGYRRGIALFFFLVCHLLSSVYLTTGLPHCPVYMLKAGYLSLTCKTCHTIDSYFILFGQFYHVKPSVPVSSSESVCRNHLSSLSPNHHRDYFGLHLFWGQINLWRNLLRHGKPLPHSLAVWISHLRTLERVGPATDGNPSKKIE